MELELYAKVPDGYELVGFRTPKESEVYINLFGEPVISPAAFEVSRCRMIVRKIKPRIKRSFWVDVLEVREGVTCASLKEDIEEFSGIDVCIVTELPVENE